jgi:hypothetical protein
MKHRRTILYVVLSMVCGIALAGFVTEASYRFQTRAEDRGKQRVVLTIPQGTAEQVANGQGSPSIPKDITFVAGDTLLVINEDSVDHQLGPLFIPKKSSASLKFDQPGSLAYTCSFSPDKYLGFDIKAPLTWSTRSLGILSAGIPMGILIALYVVFAIRPGLKKESQPK